jgi:hypothetical protein
MGNTFRRRERCRHRTECGQVALGFFFRLELKESVQSSQKVVGKPGEGEDGNSVHNELNYGLPPDEIGFRRIQPDTQPAWKIAVCESRAAPHSGSVSHSGRTASHAGSLKEGIADIQPSS